MVDRTQRILLCVAATVLFGSNAGGQFNEWGQVYSQWRTIHRPQIALGVYNAGMAGRRTDTWRQHESPSFSYPAGRNMLAYSGGNVRVGWNPNNNSQGEGFWVMSRTGGITHISFAGSVLMSEDVEPQENDVSQWPEAYLGVDEHDDYALAIQRGDSEAAGTVGANLRSIGTTYRPGSGPVSDQLPVSIWNYRFGRYNSGIPFDERVAAGELPALSPPAWAAALSEDAFPEQIMIGRARSSETGLEWTRKWFGWGHPDYDDFLINESIVENTSSETAEDVYIVIENLFRQNASIGWHETSNGKWGGTSAFTRDDHARSTAATNYLTGVPTAAFLGGEGKPVGSVRGADLADRGHPMLYFHDGEGHSPSQPHNDVGEPWILGRGSEAIERNQAWVKHGVINQGHYFGIGVVDAMPPFNSYGGLDPESYVSPHDNPDTPRDESVEQPATAVHWEYNSFEDEEGPHPGRDAIEEIYERVATAGIPDEPETTWNHRQFLAFGPYDLAPGEKAKVVVGYAAGMAGDAPKYSDYRRYAKPFNFGWMLLYDGPGRETTFEQRQPEVPLGEDVMFEHFERAIQAYNWGYDIPNQPPSVKLATQSDLGGRNVISWSAAGEGSLDPDYTGAEAEDITGYRIYRSITESKGPWELLAEFTLEDVALGNLPRGVSFDPNAPFRTTPNSADPEGIPLRENRLGSGLDPAAGGDLVPGVYRLVDQKSKAGFAHWYSVRMVDAPHGTFKGEVQGTPVSESAVGPSGAAVTGGRYGVVPVVPSDEVFDRLEKRIAVVPNPWHIGSPNHSYNGLKRIRFINLPSRAQIEIYDVMGQRIWREFAEDPTKGEVTWEHQTFANPSITTISPGVYFWKVTSLVPDSAGQTQTGTLVIIQ